MGLLRGGQGTTLKAGLSAQLPDPRGTSVLTQLAHFQDVAQHLGQLYAAAAEGTFMLIFPAAVLKDDLHGGKGTGPKGT